MADERTASMAGVIAISERWVRWLVDDALPLWEAYGIDRADGGYFEDIAVSADGAVLVGRGDVRRGRVVARQIYAFNAGIVMGWCPTRSDPVDHGCNYLFSRMYGGDGLFSTAIDARTHASLGTFSLYEHAFYLFALAQVRGKLDGRYPAAATAERCLEQLRSGWGKVGGGFDESRPSTVPLKSNPHMHLLEAALAWRDVTDGRAQLPWTELAEEIVRLCLTHFIDAGSGAIREYFDEAWQPMSGDCGRVVEPGHQFEWAWLLHRWASSSGLNDNDRKVCRDAAERLLAIGEERGIDPEKGIAVNELWDDLRVKDSAAKVWPQTERLKAWCVALQHAATIRDAEWACGRIVSAGKGLARFVRQQPSGLWRETCSANGQLVDGPSKASSFYHIVCAIEVLHSTVAGQQRAVPRSP